METNNFQTRQRLGAALILICAITLLSCKKEEQEIRRLGSISIINAVAGGTAATFENRTSKISNNSYGQYALPAGVNKILIYPGTDSLNPYYNNDKFAISEGEIYSLYLTGVPGATESILVKEELPDRTDGSVGVRFINLSPDHPSLNVTLAASNTVNEVSDLQYKSLTDFKTYSGLSTATYSFQIRDATTAAPASPLATFSLTAAQLPRFANITLVIRKNGTRVSVFRVNNDR